VSLHIKERSPGALVDGWIKWWIRVKHAMHTVAPSRVEVQMNKRTSRPVMVHVSCTRCGHGVTYDVRG